MHKKFPGMSLVDGSVFQSSNGSLVFTVDELSELAEEHSIFASYNDGKLTTRSVEWSGCGVAEGSMAGNHISIMLGEEGQCLLFSKGEFLEVESVPLREDDGPLRGISIFNECIWAYGTGPQLWRSVSLNKWERFLLPVDYGETDYMLSVESICGFQSGDLYAVGWKGHIYCRNKSGWKLSCSPTNLDLFGVLCASSGDVYVCGDDGVILVGNDDKWKLVENNLTSEKFWGICEYKERVLVASTRLLYEIKSGVLVELTESVSDEEFPSSFNRLVSCEDVMWSIGEKQLYEFDGNNKWKCLVDSF